MKYDLLKEHIPEASNIELFKLLDTHPIAIKITRERITKQGDFRVLRNGQAQISINHNLNKYSFLLTLVHELAHWATYKKHKRAKPHGVEWKLAFKDMMLPFLNNDIFPNDLLPYLAQYFINPKAAAGSDVQLSIALKKYDAPSNTTSLFELSFGSQFTLRNKTFVLGEKRRTRYECMDQKTNKKYLIHQNAEVKLIKN